jgi:DNA modification methylase
MLTEDQSWDIHNGDCIEHMATMPESSVDFSVFSPPFPSLYAYTSEHADIGNSEGLETDAYVHLLFFYRQLARIIKPGRVVMVHVMQIPRMKRDGDTGLHDFRGQNIRIAEKAGLIYEYDWLVRKNPQAQAIRTRSRELQFSGLERDRARSRGTLCDYLIKFVAPGVNRVPVDSEAEVSRNEWIEWAEGAWFGIKETDTLNTKAAKSGDDVRHICPLQLGVIERLVRLYTNPGELVFSPFTGIGSEGYVSVLQGRRFYGCELKKEYYHEARKNLERAVAKTMEKQNDLFSLMQV